MSVCNGRDFLPLYRATFPSKQRPIQARSAGFWAANPRKPNMPLIVIMKPQGGDLLGLSGEKKISIENSRRNIQARLQRNF